MIAVTEACRGYGGYLLTRPGRETRPVVLAAPGAATPMAHRCSHGNTDGPSVLLWARGWGAAQGPGAMWDRTAARDGEVARRD